MNELRGLLSRIGGPNALSVSGFWILFALNAVISLFSNPGTFSGELGSRLIIVVVSQLALMSVPYLVWRRWVVRAGRNRPWLMFWAFVAGALARGLVVLGGNAWLIESARPSLTEIAFRMGASVSTMVVAIIVIAVVGDLIREYADQAAELTRVQQDIDQVEQQVFARMQTVHTDALAQIRAHLDRMLSLDDPNAMVAQLRVSVDDFVRPLSHELAQSIPFREPHELAETQPRIQWPALLQQVARIDLFLPTTTVLFSLVASAPWLLRESQRIFVPLLFIAGLAVSWLLMTLLNVLWRALRLRTARAVFVWVSVCGVAVGLFWILVYGLAGPEFLGIIPIAIGYYLLIAWVFSLPRAADLLTRQHHEEVQLAIGQLEWELARVQAEAWQQQRSFAYALHGPVQSALTASIFRLESAIRSNTMSDAVRHQIEHEVRNTLAHISDNGTEVAPFAEVAQEIQRLWEGIAQVHISFASGTLAAINADPTANAVLVDITREACSNAVRHGHAKMVFVRVGWSSPQLIELTIASDGAELPIEPKQGLGSQLLTEATVSWSRTRRGPLTVLTAFVPIAAEQPS